LLLRHERYERSRRLMSGKQREDYSASSFPEN